MLFRSQKVAAVAAETREAADEALALIDIEYEELEGVFDPVDALRDDAPDLHPEFETYGGRAELEARRPNEVARTQWSRGDVEQGFASADLVVETTFRTQRQHQGYIEPHACVVHAERGPDGGDVARAWVNSKAPFQLRQQLAVGIGLDESAVIIEPTAIGGDFGGKIGRAHV